MSRSYKFDYLQPYCITRHPPAIRLTSSARLRGGRGTSSISHCTRERSPPPSQPASQRASDRMDHLDTLLTCPRVLGLREGDECLAFGHGKWVHHFFRSPLCRIGEMLNFEVSIAETREPTTRSRSCAAIFGYNLMFLFATRKLTRPDPSRVDSATVSESLRNDTSPMIVVVVVVVELACCSLNSD